MRGLALIPANKALALLFTVILLSGCASTSVFTPYPVQAQAYRQGIIQHKEESVLKNLSSMRQGSDAILYLLERGRIGQLANEYQSSREDFAAAISANSKNDDKALVSVSSLGAKSTSLLTNDNAIPYQPPGFERVFLHHYQALNYLAAQDLQGAGVEVRRANMLQHEALDAHNKELSAVEKKAREEQVNLDSSAFSQHYAIMDEAVGKVASSFQNAYTFYFSGLVYEALNQPNDAYIDYKKALQIFPDNHYLQDDLLRLARQLGMREDYQRFQQQFGRDAGIIPANSGSLVILYEQGFVAAKEEIKIPIPTVHGWITIAFPIYREPWHSPTPLQVSVDGQQSMHTQAIVYVYSLAAKALKEQLTPMLLRQTLRATAKYAMQKQAEKQGILLAFATQVYNLVSESADRRSWLTLPNNAQILRQYLSAGEHRLQLGNSGNQQTLDINVRANRTTVLRVTQAGSRLIIQEHLL